MNQYSECKEIETAVIEYIKKYDKFIIKLAVSVKRKCPKLEIEDIKQQLILSLLTNTKNYKPYKEVSDGTYFSQVTINASLNIVKKYWQEKNRINVESVSLDNYIIDGPEQFISFVQESEDSYYNPHNYVRRNEIFSHLANTKKDFSRFENRVFELYMEGKTISEISKKVRKSKKTIYNTIASIREKLKDINYL